MNTFLGLTPEQINFFAHSPLFTIMEFAALSAMVLITYYTLHNLASHYKPAIKFLLSLFIGTVGYSIGKVALFAIIINPLFAAN